MKVTVITPTCNRPVGLEQAVLMLALQTRQADEWLICRNEEPPGPINLALNIQNGLARATGDVIIIWEDDDWYHPTHIERLVRQFEEHKGLFAAGDDLQRYYNLPQRVYRTFDNVGASLCQTAISAAAKSLLSDVAHVCSMRGSYGIDTTFWREAIGSYETSLVRTKTVVGLKGLPGQPGLGVGHRPKGSGWLPDPTGQILAEWIGDEDAKHYRSLVPAV